MLIGWVDHRHTYLSTWAEGCWEVTKSGPMTSLNASSTLFSKNLREAKYPAQVVYVDEREGRGSVSRVCKGVAARGVTCFRRI